MNEEEEVKEKLDKILELLAIISETIMKIETVTEEIVVEGIETWSIRD